MAIKKKPSLLLVCGCVIPFEENGRPICPSHGNQAVARVIDIPAPRIRGVATGPHVQTMDLPAYAGRFAGSGVKE